MKKIRINLYGCDDTTSFEMEVTDEQLEFIETVAKRSEEVSTCRCMPTIDIDKIIEGL
jgi:hypothetical protein